MGERNTTFGISGGALGAIIAGLVAIIVALIQFVIGPCYSRRQSEDDHKPTTTATETQSTATERSGTHEATSQGTSSGPTTTEGSPKKIGKWQAQRVKVWDRTGKSGILDIIVLSREYRWQCGSITVANLAKQPEDLLADFRSEGMQTRFRELKAVVAVGTASHEGTESQENQRASDRADALVVWLRRAIVQPIPLWGLVLGQRIAGLHDERCSERSDVERPVIILGVVAEDTGFDLESGIHDAFDKGKVPIPQTEYALFKLDLHT